VNSPRSYLLVFLALTTLGCAILAWNQRLEIIKLNAALQAKDWEVEHAQQHQDDLESKLTALRASEKAAATARPYSADDQRPRGRFGNMQALMDDPKFAQLVDLQEKARLDSSYAPLFKQLAQQLGLTPAQITVFQNLLVQKQDAARDVLTAARDQGADHTEINQLITQSNAEIDNQIQSTLGATAFAQYQTYQQTLPERNTVNAIKTSLSYTSAPLSDPQAQQLISVLANNSTKAYNPTSIRALINPNVTSPITPAVITTAQTFLSPPQIAVLVNQQAVQQANATIAAAIQPRQMQSVSASSQIMEVRPNSLVTPSTATP
jgi:hypothetical protein